MDGPTGSLRRFRNTKSNGAEHDLDMGRPLANCNEAPKQITGANVGESDAVRATSIASPTGGDSLTLPFPERSGRAADEKQGA